MEYNEIKLKQGDTKKVEPENQTQEDGTQRQVISATVTAKQKKKGIFERMVSGFMGTNGVKHVTKSIFTDVLLPNIRDIMITGLKDGIDMYFYGTVPNRARNMAPGRSYNRNGSNQTDYNGISRNGRQVLTHSNNLEVPLITFHTRGEAEEVLDELKMDIQDRGFAKVTDFFNMTGNVIKDYPKAYMGWYDLRGAAIYDELDNDGNRVWVLDMPVPENIKNR